MWPIRVSENGRYFVDAEGKPFFWLGDTQWELFRLFTPEDAAEVLRRRKDQGFSVVQVMFTGVGDGTGANLDGHRPWVDNDPLRPDEAYFSRVDRTVQDALDVGMVLVVGLYHQLQRQFITVDNARGWARWIARRYGEAPHLIWTMYPEARPDFLPVMRELAAGLREGEALYHLITVHPDPSPASSSFCHSEPWLDFNMIQTWHYLDQNVPMVQADYALTPPKPTVMAEGGYETAAHTGRPWTPLDCRQQAWWSYLAGGHHSYGHHGNWAHPQDWRDWIDSPGARQMSLCRQVLTSLPEWWDLVPDQSLLTAGEGQGAERNVAARAGSDRWALVYLSAPATVRLDMGRVCGGNASRATWINPADGRRLGVEPGEVTGGAEFTTPAGWEDALLLFER